MGQVSLQWHLRGIYDRSKKTIDLIGSYHLYFYHESILKTQLGIQIVFRRVCDALDIYICNYVYSANPRKFTNSQKKNDLRWPSGINKKRYTIYDRFLELINFVFLRFTMAFGN